MNDRFVLESDQLRIREPRVTFLMTCMQPQGPNEIYAGG